MANTKEIKNRINSVKDTQKITNAMYLIASTKMRRAKAELEKTKPYFENFKDSIKDAFAAEQHAKSKFFETGSGKGTWGYLVITADKGLAGAYNQNVLKEVVAQLEKHDDNKIYVVGEFGRRYFASSKIAVDENFNYLALQPTIARAREMSEYLLKEFIDEKISKLFVVYTDFKGGLSGGTPATYEILPFDREEFTKEEAEEGEKVKEFEFVPSVLEVIDNLIPSYMMGIVYSSLVESFCSEQNARMTAMDAANQNADEILSHLSVEYNHVRQGAITQEITEVSSGARAKKKNAKKREGDA